MILCLQLRAKIDFRYFMKKEFLEEVKQALVFAPRNHYIAELHLQSSKYADGLSNITARAFCEALGFKANYATEFIR